MLATPSLLDTCVVLSLYASRHMDDILHANEGPFLIAEAVLRESLYVHVVVDGVREKEPISLESLILNGTITVVEPETEAELQSLIDFSVKLDEGEAMTCALALHRGYRMATDERKTIRIVGERVQIVGGLDMVRAWVDSCGIPSATVRDALRAIEDRGYVPGPSHVHFEWWRESRSQ